MNAAVLRQLIWKEVREQWTWALLACVVLVTFTAVGLRSRVVADAIVISMSQLLGSVALPIVVAMGLVAPQRAEGTLASLLRLPVPAWVSFAVKTVTGMAMVALPLCAATVVAWWIAAGREYETRHIVWVFHQSLWIGWGAMIWTLCVGIAQPSEARVGMVGLALLVFGVVSAVMIDAWVPNQIQKIDAMGSAISTTLPMVGVGWRGYTPWTWRGLQVAIWLVLWLIALRWYRKPRVEGGEA